MGRWATVIVCAALALAGCTRPNDLYGGGTGGGAAGSDGNGGGGGSGGVADLATGAAHDLSVVGDPHDLAIGGGHDLAHPVPDLAQPQSCGSTCSRCATTACCGNSCCGSGEWCDKGTCRCGDGAACGVAQSCGGGNGGFGQCGVKCCTAGILCP